MTQCRNEAKSLFLNGFSTIPVQFSAEPPPWVLQSCLRQAMGTWLKLQEGADWLQSA